MAERETQRNGDNANAFYLMFQTWMAFSSFAVAASSESSPSFYYGHVARSARPSKGVGTQAPPETKESCTSVPRRDGVDTQAPGGRKRKKVARRSEDATA